MNIDGGAPLELDPFFERAPDHLVLAGFDGYFKRLSPAWLSTFGWSPKELLERPSLEFVHPDDREAVLAARSRLKQGVPLTGLVNRYQRKDGMYRWLEWRSVSHSERELVYAVARDVTEEKLLEQSRDEAQKQLSLAERMATVGTLAAGVAHEINNPLAYIMSNLGMLVEDLSGGGLNQLRANEVQEMLTEALAGAERVKRIVQGLQKFSAAHSYPRETLTLEPVLTVALERLLPELRSRARVVTDFVTTPPIEGNEGQLCQVFASILLNAAQAIPPGNVEENEIRVVTTTDAEGRAVAEFRDTGEGIPDTMVNRVFDPFFTTRPVGTGVGLGLSISHALVSALGGQIRVGKNEGRGSVFRVSFPAKR